MDNNLNIHAEANYAQKVNINKSTGKVAEKIPLQQKMSCHTG